MVGADEEEDEDIDSHAFAGGVLRIEEREGAVGSR